VTAMELMFEGCAALPTLPAWYDSNRS